VRNDGGVMRAHFGFTLNNSDPRACTSGYASTASTPTPAAVASLDTGRIGCDVVNGVDPNPGDGADESGSDIRGAQNIGRTGGQGTTGTTGTSGAGGISSLTTTIVDQVLGGVLSANPFARTLG
jgi:phospholipid/cholesterol/gamma-HCH transport system substrate-binding protein